MNLRANYGAVPRLSGHATGVGIGAGLLLILLFLGVVFGAACFWGWILMLVVGAFGYNLAFWPAVGIMALANAFLGLIGHRS